MTLLDVQDISFSYHTLKGEISALSHISFQVNSGEFLAVVGPSGCGKTTLISMLAGLLAPEEGNILYTGDNNIGYMLQKDHLLEWRSVYQNVLLGLEIRHKKDERHISYVDQLLKDYGLYDFRNKKPSELSGGMRQRAALIRTIAMQPSLLLLDEPFSALDYQTRLNVSADIVSIIKANNKTAVMITHDLSEAVTFSDRVIVLSKRPATVVCDVKIDIPMDRSDPLKVKAAPEYHKYFDLLWKSLMDGKEVINHERNTD